MSDRASSLVGAAIGVTIGGILTLYGMRIAVDWAIARAVQAG
ncbi:hypothetical protein [Streptomyces nigrescens]